MYRISVQKGEESMNKAILVGRLTRDPEVRYSQDENPTAVARYTVAVDRRFKREGETTADFIPCVVFGRSAEFTEKYFRSLIYTYIFIKGEFLCLKSLYKKMGCSPFLCNLKIGRMPSTMGFLKHDQP